MGDVLICCLVCGAVLVDAEARLALPDVDTLLRLPAGAEIPGDTGPCPACDEQRGFRLLIGPLHVPRPEGRP